MCINIILRQEKIGSFANKMLSLFGKIQNHTKILFKKDEKISYKKLKCKFLQNVQVTSKFGFKNIFYDKQKNCELSFANDRVLQWQGLLIPL